MTKNLFDPLQLGAIACRNRIFMAPLTRCRASPGSDAPHALNTRYYAQRASAGLIISEGTQVSAVGKGYAGFGQTPGIYSEQQEAGWREVTSAVHAQGGAMVAQLWHVGRVSHSSMQPGGALPVAPSAIAAPGKVLTTAGETVPYEVPRALLHHEIAEIVAQYRHAAEVAQRAGFDGVELHSAHGYLLEQFIRDASNQRDDEYGGSVQRRLRFALEVVDALVAVWGKGRVGVRLSPVSLANSPGDSQPQQTYGALVDALAARGLAYLHFVEGNTGRSRQLDGVDFAAARRSFPGAYIANNQYTLTMAQEAISSGAADAVAFGVPFISNPDLVVRIAHGWPWAAAKKARFYGGGAAGYTDYAVYQNEGEREHEPAADTAA